MFNQSSIVASAAVAIALSLGIAHAEAADQAGKQGNDQVMTPDNVEWAPCGVPQFPGCEAALLQGDPATGPYSMYVRIPAGHSFPPHWHSNPHYLVGVEGTLTFAYQDGSIVTLSPGTFGYWPGNELMMGRCGDDAACVYYDHQTSFGDVHFPTDSAAAGGHAQRE